MAKKAAKKGGSKKAPSKKGRPLLSYRVKHKVDLELSYEDGHLALLSVLSHDPDENDLLEREYLCIDAGVMMNADEWILQGMTDYHGLGKSIEIIVPKELILSMRIENLD